MSVRRTWSRFTRSRLLLLCSAAILFGAAGCQPMIEALPLEEITGQTTSTATPNPTLLAVERMLTATASAPTATQTPIPTPTRMTTATATVEVVLEGSQKLPAPAGQPFTLGSMTISVLASQLTDQVGRLKAQEGQTYLDLEVLLENEGKQPVSYTPFYLRLRGPNGKSYQPAVDSLHPGLLSGTLRAGEQVRGHVAFAVPDTAGDGDFRLILRPDLADLPPGTGLREAWIALLGPSDGDPSVPETGELAGWPPAGLPEPGQRVEAAGVGLAVEDVDIQERVEFGRAEKGSQFVVLAVRIDNVDHPRLPYNPLYFRVKDQAGYEYLPTAGSPETSLQAGSLGPRQSVAGRIIFEVPISASELVLSYLPTVLFEEYEEIRVGIVGAVREPPDS